MFARLSLVALLLFSSIALADQIADASRSQSWLRLYQYKKKLRGYRSSITADRFFFSSTGRTDPEAEMRAAVEAYSQHRVVGTQQQPATCVFPARLKVLELLIGRTFERDKCPDLKNWIEGVNADEAHLVFVGAYAGNPASILGHTFVRLANSKREKSGREGMDLLSYSVGFQALANPNDSRATYMLKGLTGGYNGSYEIEKHYIKVGLYNNAESRDLWDVKLNFTPAEVEFLILHLWELTFNAQMKYYFVDENCSYRLITFLEAARPDADVSGHLSTVVLPAETVRAAIRAGWTTADARFRASIKRRMNIKLTNLSPAQMAQFDRARVSLSETKTTNDSAVLDALLDYWLYQNYRVRTKLDPESKAIMEATYTQAAHLPVAAIFSSASDAEIQRSQNLAPPFWGHKPKWLSIAGGATSDGGLAALSYRSGVQPFWSSDRAYEGVAAVEYLGADIEWRRDRPRWNLLLIDAKSIENWRGADGHVTWSVDARATNHCLICESTNPQAHFSGGAGWATKGRLTAYVLAHAHTATWGDSGLQGMISPGALVGLRLSLASQLTWTAESGEHWWKSRRDFDADSRLNFAFALNQSAFLEAQYEDLSDRAVDASIRTGLSIFF